MRAETLLVRREPLATQAALSPICHAHTRAGLHGFMQKSAPSSSPAPAAPARSRCREPLPGFPPSLQPQLLTSPGPRAPSGPLPSVLQKGFGFEYGAPVPRVEFPFLNLVPPSGSAGAPLSSRSLSLLSPSAAGCLPSVFTVSLHRPQPCVCLPHQLGLLCGRFLSVSPGQTSRGPCTTCVLSAHCSHTECSPS